MSEGRMDNGVLECRYHGWQFNAKGDCIANPQSDGPARACLTLYPTQVWHTPWQNTQCLLPVHGQISLKHLAAGKASICLLAEYDPRGDNLWVKSQFGDNLDTSLGVGVVFKKQ